MNFDATLSQLSSQLDAFEKMYWNASSAEAEKVQEQLSALAQVILSTFPKDMTPETMLSLSLLVNRIYTLQDIFGKLTPIGIALKKTQEIMRVQV